MIVKTWEHNIIIISSGAFTSELFAKKIFKITVLLEFNIILLL